jgi:threonyl-tRNA synthetase
MSISQNSQNLNLDIKRHTFAHIMAAAVKQMFPEAQFGVGPIIENGCYYDFVLPRTLIPEDVPLIENHIKNILKNNIQLKRQEISLEEAIIFFTNQNQPLKVELLENLRENGTTKLSEEEKADFDTNSKLPIITIYRLVNETTGEVYFEDLCKGPHIEGSIKYNDFAFELDKFSSSYWRGDQARGISMQRLYAIVFETKDELKAYLNQREEAKKRDHRILGTQLEIYTISEDVGSGLLLYMPKGAVIRQLLEKYCYQEATKAGYQYVYTPHIGKSDLFAKSGHLDHYADGMFAPIDMVNLKGEGVVEGQKVEKFYLKPMNCPMHHQIYLNRPRSYKELPYRLYEYGTVYRYEESGTLSGMIRVRGFTQNDAHVYCQTSQLKEVIEEALNRFTNAYKAIGINDYKIRFSLPDFVNDTEKFGNVETQEWKDSVNAMRTALDDLKIDYYEAVGEAAFYGPKIDIQVKNVNGKEDSLSTIQVDYSIAPKFGIKFINNKGEEETPAIIHMALMGSVDRFMAFMIEMTGGKFPLWVAPVQVKILTINDDVLPYAKKVTDILNNSILMKPLKYNEIRYELDNRNEGLGKKIRDAKLEKVPILIILGPKDVIADQVSIEYNGESLKLPIDELKTWIEKLAV